MVWIDHHKVSWSAELVVFYCLIAGKWRGFLENGGPRSTKHPACHVEPRMLGEYVNIIK